MSPKFLSLISILVNLGLASLKFIIGFFSHSIALMASALDSGLDIISSFITFVGIRTAEKPADIKHPYGHERYESLVSFVIVLLLFASAGWVLFEAAKNIVTKEEMAQFSLLGIMVMAVSVIITEIMARLKFYFGNKFSSLALVADAEHSRADVISSSAVLGGLFLVKFYPLADSFLAVFVAGYIFYQAYRLGKEAVDSLVDTANLELENKIQKFLQENNYNFESIKTRKIGPSNFAEVSLLYNPRVKIDEATALTKKIEEKLLNAFPELKQVSLLVKSHEFTENITRPRFGRFFRFHRGFEKIGPAKPFLLKGKGKRIVVPLENDEIAPEFGASHYLIVDIDEDNKVLQKTKVKNPYFEAGGPAHGAKFIKSVSADKVMVKYIGENAKINLENLGIEVEIIDEKTKISDLKYSF